MAVIMNFRIENLPNIFEYLLLITKRFLLASKKLIDHIIIKKLFAKIKYFFIIKKF